MNFQINPCKAVMNKLSTSGCDINKMNELCYGICKSYGDTYEGVSDDCRDQCAAMISDKKKQYGFTDCTKRQPTPPPGWFQIPSLFPSLLRKFNDPQQAYTACCQMAMDTPYPKSTREKCKLDADALILPTIENFEHKDNKKSYMSNFLLIIVIFLVIILFTKFYYYS